MTIIAGTPTAWSIVRRLLPLLLVVIELTWIVPWSFLAGTLLAQPGVTGQSRPDLPSPLISVFGVGALVVGACAVAQVAARLARKSVQTDNRASKWFASGTSVGTVVVGAILSLRDHEASLSAPSSFVWVQILTGGHDTGALLVALIATSVIWWRGASVGGTSAGDRGAGRQAIATGALIALASAISRAVLPALNSAVIPAATAIALPTMIGTLSLASLEEAQTTRPGGLETRAPDRAWLVMIGVLCLGVAIVGALFALIISGQASMIIGVTRVLGNVVAIGVIWVAMALMYPVLLFAEWLRGLMRGRGEPPADLAMGNLGRREPAVLLEDVAGTPAINGDAVQLAIGAVVLALLAYLSWRLLRPAPTEDLDGAESEERTTVFSWEQLMPRRRRRAPTTDVASVDDGVRLAYRAFLHHMSERGLPRLVPESPAKFGRRIASGLTIASHDQAEVQAVTTLTHAYEQARYGPTRTTSDQETQARQAVDTITRGLTPK